MAAWFDTLRQSLFNVLLTTFGSKTVEVLGWFMTGLLALGDSRDEFFVTLEDAVAHATEQKHPDGTPYTNDEMRAYVDAIMEVWLHDKGFAMSVKFAHQVIAMVTGNLSPLAQGAGNAVVQIADPEAGARVAGFIEKQGAK